MIKAITNEQKNVLEKVVDIYIDDIVPAIEDDCFAMKEEINNALLRIKEFIEIVNPNKAMFYDELIEYHKKYFKVPVSKDGNYLIFEDECSNG